MSQSLIRDTIIAFPDRFICSLPRIAENDLILITSHDVHLHDGRTGVGRLRPLDVPVVDVPVVDVPVVDAPVVDVLVVDVLPDLLACHGPLASYVPVSSWRQALSIWPRSPLAH